MRVFNLFLRLNIFCLAIIFNMFQLLHFQKRKRNPDGIYLYFLSRYLITGAIDKPFFVWRKGNILISYIHCCKQSWINKRQGINPVVMSLIVVIITCLFVIPLAVLVMMLNVKWHEAKQRVNLRKHFSLFFWFYSNSQNLNYKNAFI